MGKMHCSEGFVSSNSASVSINATIKKDLSITVDVFAHFWGRKFYDVYYTMLVWK